MVISFNADNFAAEDGIDGNTEGAVTVVTVEMTDETALQICDRVLEFTENGVVER